MPSKRWALRPRLSRRSSSSTLTALGLAQEDDPPFEWALRGIRTREPMKLIASDQRGRARSHRRQATVCGACRQPALRGIRSASGPPAQERLRSRSSDVFVPFAVQGLRQRCVVVCGRRIRIEPDGLLVLF